jgi:carbon-monoxide dehydrogenase small subunit
VTAIELTVNGRHVKAEVEPRTHLADFLREHLLLTGTHIGCEHGICGACTVEIDGEIARSCITYAVACDGATVRSIEAFDDDELMGRLRQAFTKEHALQCGYCTPGMLIAARDLIRRRKGLSRAEIRTEMSGNLCRCTGYVGIVRSIERVMAEEGSATAARSPSTRRWLGPAPGPASAAQARQSGLARSLPEPPMASGSAEASGAARAAHGRPYQTRRRIKVETGIPHEADGATLLNQSFLLEHSREAVWRVMSDPKAIAACMPGLTIEEPSADGKVNGRMQLALGPISAAFAGEGQISSFADEYRQIISGRGGDRKSGSSASGRIAYTLRPQKGPLGGEATRVEVELSYALAGPFAQFGRSGLLRDFVSRIGESFAQNLDARLLAPEGTATGPAKLNLLSLVWSTFMARAVGFVARLFGRRTREP